MPSLLRRREGLEIVPPKENMNIPSINNGKMVECLLCGEFFDSITWSHLKYMHGITTQDYQEEFDYPPMQGEDFIERRIEPIRGIVQDEEYCEMHSRAAQEWWDSPEGEKRKKILPLTFHP